MGRITGEPESIDLRQRDSSRQMFCTQIDCRWRALVVGDDVSNGYKVQMPEAVENA